MSSNHGKILRQALLERKISIQDFANKYLDFSRQSLQALLKKEDISYSRIALFCSLLGMEPEDFNLSSKKMVSKYSSEISLSGAEMRGLSLENGYLKGVNWSNGSILHSTFSACYMPFSNFTKSSLDDVSFINTQLFESDFSFGKFKNIDFSHSNLTGVNLYNADLTQANLKHCDLTNISNWEECILNHALIKDVINPPEEFVNWALATQRAYLNEDEWKRHMLS